MTPAALADLVKDIAAGNDPRGELIRRGIPPATADAVVAQYRRGVPIEQAIAAPNAAPTAAPVAPAPAPVVAPAPAPAPTPVAPPVAPTRAPYMPVGEAPPSTMVQKPVVPMAPPQGPMWGANYTEPGWGPSGTPPPAPGAASQQQPDWAGPSQQQVGVSQQQTGPWAQPMAQSATTAQQPYTAPAATPQMAQQTAAVAQPPPPSIQWGQHADGTMGWIDKTGGRTWDATGNAYTPGPAPAQPVAPGQAPAAVAPAVATVSPGLAAQQQAANPLVDWFKTRGGNAVNAFNFNKMKGSTQEMTLAAAEAAGHDKQDVYEDIQKTLPKAVGARRGYVAPMGSR